VDTFWKSTIWRRLAEFNSSNGRTPIIFSTPQISSQAKNYGAQPCRNSSTKKISGPEKRGSAILCPEVNDVGVLDLAFIPDIITDIGFWQTIIGISLNKVTSILKSGVCFLRTLSDLIRARINKEMTDES
jgi:hypothetical protein